MTHPTEADTDARTVEGVAVPPGRYVAQGVQRARYWTVLGLLALGLGVSYAGISVWDQAVRDAPIYACPPDCGSPPNAVPVANLPQYDGAGYSVSRPPPGPPYDVTTGDDGVTARLTSGGGVLRLFSQPARGRVARQAALAAAAQPMCTARETAWNPVSSRLYAPPTRCMSH